MNLLNPVIRSSGHLRIDFPAERTDSAQWAPLYRVAAWAALLVVAFVPVQAAVYFASPPPDTVLGWFKLFHRNPLLGLLEMDLLMVVDTVLAAILMLALVVVLWRAAPALMALAGAIGLVGAAAFFSSNPAFSMLALSNKYWDATTDAQRGTYLAAGEAMMSTWNGTAYLVFYLLGAIATLIFAYVMLRGDVFSRITGWFGVIAGVLMLWPPVNTVFLIISFLSLIPMVVWYVLVALRLLQLARGEPAGVPAMRTDASRGRG